MAADMKTIAERVGVSKTTVHRALSNSGRISEETRERIIRVARELDYRPNNLARGLRSQKSATIGVIAIGLTNSFYSTILDGIQDAAIDSGYSILLACSDGRPSRELMHLNVLREKRVDGIIIAPAHPKDNLHYFQKLKQSGLPFVFIDRYMPDIDADYVMTDNFAGGYAAGKHLVSQGRKRIGFGCVSQGEMNATSVKERLRGLQTALEEEGAEFAGLIGRGMPNLRPQEAFAAASVEGFIRAGNRVDAILATNDNIAIGLITGVKNMKLKVPDDIAIMGFDDLDIAQFVRPALTTIRQPSRKIGEEAMRLLTDRISASQDMPSKHLLLPPELVIRESCGANKPEEG